jgi:hypothetical protein
VGFEHRGFVDEFAVRTDLMVLTSRSLPGWESRCETGSHPATVLQIDLAGENSAGHGTSRMARSIVFDRDRHVVVASVN